MNELHGPDSGCDLVVWDALDHAHRRLRELAGIDREPKRADTLFPPPKRWGPD